MKPYRSGDYAYVLRPDGTAEISALYAEYAELTVPARLNGYAVTELGEYAFGIPFEEYSSFEDPVGRLWETVIIEDGIRILGDRCFCHSHYMNTIRIPDSVTSIGIGAFLECGLEEIHVPDSVSFLGRAAFSDCHFLRRAWLPDSVTVLEDSLFEFCNSMSEIRLPAALTCIGRCTFRDCRSLTALQLPDTVTSIGDYAFLGCINLQQLTVPAGVTFIGEDAFLECDKLTLIVPPDSYAEQYAKENRIPYHTEHSYR